MYTYIHVPFLNDYKIERRNILRRFQLMRQLQHLGSVNSNFWIKYGQTVCTNSRLIGYHVDSAMNR